ncbi:hypothetical protein Trihar35433_713 [Trichoderma harzianum]|nr:hypothetical protein Trihar35433_713 [Trichoderma harzianum]
MGVILSSLRFLRRLLGYGDNASNSGVNEMNPLYQLPPELFRMVINNLGLHDQFVLSQTSRGLRDVFRRHWEWEISQLPSNDRSRFWAGLAFTFPDHWACPQCCRLHPIDESDTPNTPQNPPCGADLSLRIINPRGYSYSLQQNHIQNALKLSRMGNSHQNYLDSLMRPHTLSRMSEFMFEPSFTETYTARPRIINGRFILHQEWVITDEISVMRPLFDHITIPGCPHLNVFGKGIMHSKWWKRTGARMTQGDNPRLRANVILEQAIENAIIYEGCGILCSCPRCPTDFEVRVSEDLLTATIRAWHDFGGEGAPVDTGWDAHVKSPGLSDWLYERLRFGHVPGSIEKLWVYTPEESELASQHWASEEVNS